MTVDLTAQQRDVVLSILEEELGRLKGEIYKTETWEYEEQLKERESLLIAAIDRLKESA
jgi:hypothetical protein